MNRKESFVLLVQTAAIVESLSRGYRSMHPHRLSTLAAIAVDAAIEVPEEVLPEDLTEACDQLIEYVYEDSLPKPRWLIGIL